MLVHAFLIKYAEIALKGKNRYRFEDALVHQMEIALSKIEGDFEVKKEQGRVYVFCPENYDYDEAVEDVYKRQVHNIPLLPRLLPDSFFLLYEASVLIFCLQYSLPYRY